MRLDAFTILSKALKERSPRDSGGHPWPKSLPQGQSDLRIQSGAEGHQHQQDRTDLRRSFQFYTFLEDLILWLPDFPLVVIMFYCWLAGATLTFDCGSQERSQFWLQLLLLELACLFAWLLACSSVLIVNEPTQTWYLSDALKDDCFSWFVGLGIFISIFLIFWWILVNHQNLEKVCKYLCNIWESV